MAQLIRSLGHDVTVVGRVDDALAATQQQAFDLIVSDVGLPDGTGLDFVKAFREHSDAPAVALTGFGTDEDVRRCLSAGFTSHLTKPVNFAQLETMIEGAVNLKAQKARMTLALLTCVGAPSKPHEKERPVATAIATGLFHWPRPMRRIVMLQRGEFFNESRISRSSSTSSGVGGGSAGAASAGLRRLLMNLTIRKMMNARMMKLISTVMNEP